MSTLESKIGDFLFDTSCELGLKGNDLLQQCVNILQQKMSKLKPSDLHHPVPVPAQSLSIEIPSSTRATPGSRCGFSPYPSSAFSSRSTVLRAASKESCVLVREEEENDEQLNVSMDSMDSDDVNLVDGLSDATICSNLTNDLADQMEADNSVVVDSSANNEEKPKRKRAPKQVDPLKAAMKARKDELLKEKQAQKLAKVMEKEAKAAEKEAKAAEKAKEKLKRTSDVSAAASEEIDGEPKRKPKRKVAESSSSSSADFSASSSTSENVEPEKKKRRTRKALDVQAAAKAVVIDDDDMFGDREEARNVENKRVEDEDQQDDDVEAEIEGFIDESEEDGVSIDGGEVEDIWQKKLIDGKPFTISSMTNKVYNSSLFVVGERNPETGDIRFYSTSPLPAAYEMKA
jgi:hypothetical protein